MNRIEIIGTGHHERASYATEVIRRLSEAGFDVVVHTDLRPRLAADMVALLEAGAGSVRLAGFGIAALVLKESNAGAIPPLDSGNRQCVEVMLVAGSGETRAVLAESSDPQSAEVLGTVLNVK